MPEPLTPEERGALEIAIRSSRLPALLERLSHDQVAEIARMALAAVPRLASPVAQEAAGERERLLNAVNWLMGCDGEFAPPYDGLGSHWWRSAFINRAGCFEWDRWKGSYRWQSAASPVVEAAATEGGQG